MDHPTVVVIESVEKHVVDQVIAGAQIPGL